MDANGGGQERCITPVTMKVPEGNIGLGGEGGKVRNNQRLRR